MAKTPQTAGNGGTVPQTEPVPAAAATKQQKAFVVYVTPGASGEDGTVSPETVSNFPNAEASVIRTEFANGVKRDFNVSAVVPSVSHCAELQGYVTRTQRAYQALKNIDDVIEAYDETIADILAGVWIESRAGAPKVTMLSKAIIMTIEAAGGTVDDARRASIIEKLKATDYREKAEANEHVMSNLQQLKLDAQKLRATEAKAAAKAKGGDVAASLSDF